MTKDANLNIKPLHSDADELIAAVDLGSNSFHMIVARLNGGTVQILDRLRESVRLAAGLEADGKLSVEAQRRACECLSRFGQRLQGLPRDSVRAVGTNTLRKAGNAASLLAAGEQALGHPIVVISGVEEARLIYLGVAHSLADDGAQRLVIDIGGGSTEFIIGAHYEPLYLESLHIGCVSLSRTHFDDGHITPKRFAAAELAAHMELQSIEARYQALGWDVVIGASGTIRSVDNLLKTMDIAAEGITLRYLKQLRDLMIKAEHIKRLNLEGLSQDRAPVFPGGLAILIAVFEALKIDCMQVANGALREGLLYDQIGRIKNQDIRDHSAAILAARNHVDPAQAERVRRTALLLLSQVASRWELAGGIGTRFLTWAAQLHEIGLDIAHTQHHKHGAYVVEHADLMGFALEEQRLLAALIRGQRRKFPVEIFQNLLKKWQQPALYLAVLLRLAVVLHRSRSETPLPQIDIEAENKSLRMTFPPEWLDQHPLTKAELEKEINYLKPAGFKFAVI